MSRAPKQSKSLSQPPGAAPTLLLGSAGAALASAFASAGGAVRVAAWREAAQGAALLDGVGRLVLAERGLARNAVMAWVAAAGARGVATLTPAASLPALRRAGLPPLSLGDWEFDLFPAPPADRDEGPRRRGARLAALVLLPLGLPLLGALALLVRLKDGPPVLFVQRRSGRDGRPFDIYKLRTMRLEQAARSGADTAEHGDHERRHAARRRRADARVTALGAWLRRHCLDELPQLLNLLRGELLLVGPRPLPLEDLHGAVGDSAWLTIRAGVTPGLTGLYQVTRGRHALGLADMCVLDAWYVHNRGPWLNLRLLARTLPAMLRAGVTSP
jgi:lipopolysaccharide/colanic/teichoic acid biosynthesis glycosyltransferase